MPRPLDSAGLQAYLSARIAPVRALGLEVESAEPVIVAAPLEPNVNDKGTAFAGSLFSVAALAGWAHVMRWCAAQPVAAEVMLQAAKAQFLAPARGRFRATALEPAHIQREKLARMLARGGRGRIEITVTVSCDQTVVMTLAAVYAVVVGARSQEPAANSHG
ncbi:MAG TPA: YiiD C-terminal domain-containing protein [Steroidobacteraceae bacterium]|nr:YiiD C-terminal domain-containing protein [Steroidobacteraceae bacterium]